MLGHGQFHAAEARLAFVATTDETVVSYDGFTIVRPACLTASCHGDVIGGKLLRQQGGCSRSKERKDNPRGDTRLVAKVDKDGLYSSSTQQWQAGGGPALDGGT